MTKTQNETWRPIKILDSTSEITLQDVEDWILTWPEWERRVAEALLRKEMSPGAFKETKKEGAVIVFMSPREVETKMTKDEALNLIEEYCQVASNRELEETVSGLRSRFPEDGSENKAMRWLGFMQGCLYSNEIYSLEELKEHSRLKKVK